MTERMLWQFLGGAGIGIVSLIIVWLTNETRRFAQMALARRICSEAEVAVHSLLHSNEPNVERLLHSFEEWQRHVIVKVLDTALVTSYERSRFRVLGTWTPRITDGGLAPDRFPADLLKKRAWVRDMIAEDVSRLRDIARRLEAA